MDLISRVGDDQLGSWLLKQARAEGIDTKAVAIVGGELTPLLLASVDHDGNKTFSFYRFAGCVRSADHLPRRRRRRSLSGARAYFRSAEGSLRNPTLRHESLTLARRAQAMGRTVCFSPNFRVEAWAGGAEEASGSPSGCAQPGRSGDHERNRSDAACQLAERSPMPRSGSSSTAPRSRSSLAATEPVLVIADGAVREAPTFDVDVIYDIGAGDVFHAGFLAAWRADSDPVLAASFAAAAAALKISRPPESAHMPTRAETIAFSARARIDPSALET